MNESKKIKDIDLFKDLNGAEIKELQKITKVVSLKAGQNLFRRGEKRKNFFIIASGSLRISRSFEDEEEMFALFVPGEFCCEEALAKPDSIHTKEGWIDSDAELFSIDGNAFLKLGEKNPSLAHKIENKIVEILAERLHHADNKLITLYRTGEVLSRHYPIEITAPEILQTIFEVIAASRGLFLLYNEYKKQVLVIGAIGFAGKNMLEQTTFSIANDPILTEILEKNSTIISNEKTFVKAWEKISYASPSMIGVPIRLHRRVIGALLLFDKKVGDFNINNKILLEIIAKQIAVAVHAATVEEIERAQEELKRIYIRPF